MPDDLMPFSDAAAAAMLTDVLEPGDESAGDVIGSYRLVEKIGEGGFGVVWRAEQSRPVKREVALKLLKRGMDSRQIIARFDQERRMLAAMDHPCIATMFDAGVSRDGRPYFVMEMLRGLTITAYCVKHALPLREKIAIFRDVCGAVQHAHQKGVIHRDLKPSNVLVVEVDGRPVPKIIDFGIAKAIDSGGLGTITFMTKANFILGTPQYMSPEQVSDVGGVDTRSDIYALGTLLYELLTGATPFDPHTIQERGAQAFCRIIREQLPRRPSATVTTQLAATPMAEAGPDASRLPPDLDWITLRALEKEPPRRYQSAAEFAADLQRFLDDEPVSAHPPSTAYLASRWIKRHRVAFAAACVSVLALLAGTGVALWQAKRAHEAQLRAEAESERSRETADFLNGMLAEVADEVRNGRNAEALRMALISSQKRILALQQAPDLQITLMAQVADMFDLMSDRKLAIEALRQWAELAAAHHGPESAPARTAAFRYLIMMVDHGERIEAVRRLEELKMSIEEAGGRGAQDWFRTQSLLVRAWIKLRQGGHAARVSTEMVAEARRQQMRGDALRNVLMTHVEALTAGRDFDAALAQIEECVAGARKDGDFEMHQEAFDLLKLELLEHQGLHGDAADMQEKIVDRIRPFAEPSRLRRNLLLLAEIENRAHRHAAAITHVREVQESIEARSVEVLAEGAGSDTLREDTLKAFEIETEAHIALRQHSEAAASAQKELDVASRGGNRSLISRALLSLAKAHAAAGRLEESWRFHHQRYELHAAHNASYKNRLEDLEAMVSIRLLQNRPHDALEHACDGWRQILAEPSSSHEPGYVADWAKIALKASDACRKADPSMKLPEDCSSWEKMAPDR